MLDSINQVLIENLINNCRISNKELAKINKVTEPAILKRIKNLEQSHILKYDGIINWDKINLLKMFYFTNLPNPHEIISQKPVLGFFETTGFYKHAFACFFKDEKQRKQFESLLPKERKSIRTFSFHQKPISLFNIQQKSLFNTQKMQNPSSEKEKLTQKDIRILEGVCNGGGRLSMWELSQKVRLSYETVKYRFKQLKDSGYFSLFIAQPNPLSFGINTIYLYLQFRKKIPTEKLRNVRQSAGYITCENNSILLPIFTTSFNNYMDETSKIFEDLRGELIKTEIYPIKETLVLNRYPFEYVL